MVKKRHESSAKRVRRMEKNRRKRLYPFDENTTLASFLVVHHRNRVQTLFDELRPWLLEIPPQPLTATRLLIDWQRVPRGEQWRIYELLARMTHLSDGRLTTEDRLVYLCRYLCDPAHGNFCIRPNTLEAAIRKGLAQIR